MLLAAALCLPALGTAELSVVDTAGKRELVACVEDDGKTTCLAVDRDTPPRTTPVPRRAAPASGTTAPPIRKDDKGAWQFCEGAKCRPLAKPIADALEDANKDFGEYPAITVSTDNRVVLVGPRRAFVDGRELVLKPPREYGRRSKFAELFVLELVSGTTLVAEWLDCAGPCGKAVVVDRKGRNSAWFTAGIEVPIDAKRFVVVPTHDDAVASVVNGATLRVETKSRLSSKGVLLQMTATSFGKHAVAMYWDYDDKWKINFLSPGRTLTQKVIAIERCP